MKTIIRKLADWSGVTADIERETRQDIGGRLYQDHYWFNGGIPGAWLVCNALKLYADAYKRNEYPQVYQIRTEVYKQKDKHFEGYNHR